MRKFLYISVLIAVVLAVAFGLWRLLRPRYNFLRSQSDYYQNDPLLGHRHRANVSREFEWVEHPSGRIVMRTNNLGMRRDSSVNVNKPPNIKRCLVIGDSHLDGVVYNRENFSTIVEELLNESVSRTPRIEVLNVATGYYSPDIYALSLRAYSAFAPDLLVVGMYSGNDFLEAVVTMLENQPESLGRPPGYLRRLQKANRVYDGAVSQLLNQIYFFTAFPSLIEPALDRVESLFKNLNSMAKEKGVELQIILIPTKLDVEPEVTLPKIEKVVDLLDLDRQDLGLTSQMRTELASRLKAAGIAIFDPTQEMRQSSVELYWQKDFHLNHRGHRLLAELFCGWIWSELPKKGGFFRRKK